MKNIRLLIILLALAFMLPAHAESPQVKSTRAEREYIKRGNEAYKDGKYATALADYQKAIKENNASTVAIYNAALAQLRLAGDESVDEKAREKHRENGMEMMMRVAVSKSDLAAYANYNLGNMEFEKDELKQAIEYYKQALRMNPSYDEARHNLRIAQLKQQQQDKQDQNQDKQDQQQQQQDQQQDQDKKQDQQQQQQDQQQQQQQQPENNQSDRILQAVENKEQATRARTVGMGDKKKEQNNRRNRKNW